MGTSARPVPRLARFPVFLSPSFSLSPHPTLFEGELYSALWAVFNAFQMPEEILAWAQRSSDFGPLPPPPFLAPKATGKEKNKKTKNVQAGSICRQLPEA